MATSHAVRSLKVLLLGSLMASLIVVWIFPVSAAVTLVYFGAIPGDGEVLLQWETGSEIDNAGFYVQRSGSESGGYQRISSFIPTESDGVSGADYEYTDDGLINGTTYWYRLESIDYSNTSEYSDPVSAAPGSTPTPTATGTFTLTPTSTQSQSTDITETSGPTLTRTPTQTNTLAGEIYTRTPTSTINPAYPPPATTQPSVPTNTPVPGVGTATGSEVVSSSSLDETATFVPLPSLTLSFPGNQDDMPEALAMAEGSMMDDSSQNTFQGSETNMMVEPGQILFIGVILLIWLILGGWYFLTLRKMN